jgi:hypothetical protein
MSAPSDFQAHAAPVLHVDVINRSWGRVLIESPVDTRNAVSKNIFLFDWSHCNCRPFVHRISEDLWEIAQN